MGKRDRRVDDYIEKSAAFAKPILKYIRRAVHAGCPDVEESIKWSFPHFDYKGIICGMAAFKEHCALGFWKGSLVFGGRNSDAGMGQFGRIASIKDLPDEKTLVAYVRVAAELNETGVKVPGRSQPQKRKPLPMPDDLRAALKKNADARKTFESFSPSQQREYIEWLTEAKRDETRKQRLKTTLEWLAKGKSRNWKYL
jgi:uncharacterized protein YdeI (YjbR/CyaY-like superfamily)